MTAVGIIIVAAVVTGGVVLYYHLKAKRRETFRAFAVQHGLEYSPHDPFGLRGVAVPPVQAGPR